MTKPRGEFSHVRPGDRIRAVFDKQSPSYDPVIVEFTVGENTGRELRSTHGAFTIWGPGWDVEVIRQAGETND